MNHSTSKNKQLQWLKKNPKWAGAYFFLLLEATETEGSVVLTQSEARDFFDTSKQWRVFLDKLTQHADVVIDTIYMTGERGRTSILYFNDWEQTQEHKTGTLA